MGHLLPGQFPLGKEGDMSEGKVAFCTPCYMGQIHVQTAQSINYAMTALTAAGWDAGWIYYGNVASTTKARNAMIAEAIATGFTDVIFVDSDMAFRPDAVLRLVSHDLDVVGGSMRSNVYLNDPESGEPQNAFPYAVEPLVNEKGNAVITVDDGVAEVASISTAFMRLRLKAVKELMEKVPELQYYDERVTGTDEHLYALFDHRLYPHPQPEHKAAGRQKYHGEDYAFCKLWKEHGGKVYADLAIPLRHIKLTNLDGHALSALERMSKQKDGPFRKEAINE